MVVKPNSLWTVTDKIGFFFGSPERLLENFKQMQWGGVKPVLQPSPVSSLPVPRWNFGEYARCCHCHIPQPLSKMEAF